MMEDSCLKSGCFRVTLVLMSKNDTPIAHSHPGQNASVCQ